MRILLIASEFPNPFQSSRGVYNWHTARALARKHDVAVVAALPWRDELRVRPPGTPFRRSRVVEGIEVHHPRFYYPPGVLRNAYGSFLWWSVARTVREVVARLRPGIVTSYWLHPDGEVALRAAGLARVPAVVMSGGSDVLVLARNDRRRKQIRQVLCRADAAVFVSEHLARAASQLDIGEVPTYVVRRGVDAACFHPGSREEARRELGLAPGRHALLWVGNMVPVKGLDVLIDACARIDRQGVDYVLYLVGGGPMREAIAEQARSAGIGARVCFPGVVPHDRLAHWYRAADVTVLSSWSEGVPNVLLESMSCGTPFVASDVGGVAEIADEHLDRLVPAGDASALAQALVDVLQARPAASRQRMPSSWEDSAAALEDIYVRTIATGRRHPAPE